MPLNGKIGLLRVSLESSKGTPVLGATEIVAIAPQIRREDNVINQEDALIGLGGPAPFVAGPLTGTCSFRTWLRKASAAATLDPGIFACLQACGMAADGADLALAASEATQKTLTIDHWVGGLKQRLYGASGNWQLSGEWGKPVELQFDFTGKFGVASDVAVPTPSQNSSAPIRFAGGTITLDTIGPTGGLKISKFSLNANNPVEPREDIAATSGVGYYMIGSGWRYMLELDPEAESVANWDVMGAVEAGTTGALELVLTDGVIDVTISAGKVQLMPASLGARDSKLIYDNWRALLLPTLGNDDIEIAVTAHA